MATHHVKGVVKQAGGPVARTVRVYLVSDGSLVGTTTSSAIDGGWEVLLNAGDQVFVFAVPAAGYDPDASGPWTPVPIT